MTSLVQYKDIRVLVAEDQPANRRLVDAILQSLGIKALIVGVGPSTYAIPISSVAESGSAAQGSHQDMSQACSVMTARMSFFFTVFANMSL